MAAETPHVEDALHAAEADAASGIPQFEFETWSSQIFWLVLTFAILYFVLSKFILPRLGEGLTERSDRVADDLDAASRMQKDAEQAEKAYDRSFADAKAKAHTIAETTRKSVEAEIDVEVEAADAEFAAKQADADARIRKIKTAALSKIDGIAADTAAAVVEKLTGTKPTAAQIKSAVSSAKG